MPDLPISRRSTSPAAGLHKSNPPDGRAPSPLPRPERRGSIGDGLPVRTASGGPAAPRQDLTLRLAALATRSGEASPAQAQVADQAPLLAAALEGLRELGLGRPDVPKRAMQAIKAKDHVQEIGMGVLHSTAWHVLQDVLSAQTPPAPKDRRAKNAQMNDAINKMREVNKQLGRLMRLAWADDDTLELARQQDDRDFGLLAPGLHFRQAMDIMHGHVDAPLKELLAETARQAVRLSSFPEMPQGGTGAGLPSKRTEFTDELLHALGNANYLQMFVARLEQNDTTRPEHLGALVRERLRQDLAEGNRLSPYLLGGIKAHNDLLKTTLPEERARAWSGLVSLHDGLLLNRQLPESGRLAPDTLAALLAATVASLRNVISMGIPVQPGRGPADSFYSVFGYSPAERAERFARATQAQPPKAERGDSPAERLHDEIDRLKDIADRTITALTPALGIEKDVEERSEEDAARVRGYARTLESVAEAFADLARKAQHDYGDGTLMPAAQLAELRAGLEFASYSTGLFAELAQEQLRVDDEARMALPASRPATPAGPVPEPAPQAAATTMPSAAEPPAQPAARPPQPAAKPVAKSLASPRGFQEVQAAVKEDRKLADGLVAAGQAARGRHLSALRKFKAAELIADDALALAVECFEGAAALRERALSVVQDEPYELLTQEVQAEVERANSLAEEAQQFRASPLSKRLTPDVLHKLETSGQLKLKPAQVVQTRGGGWIVELPMTVASFNDGGADRQLWLHMHLRDDVTERDPRALRPEHFVERRPDAISIKRDDERESAWDASGARAPRNPVPLSWAHAAAQRSLGLGPALAEGGTA